MKACFSRIKLFGFSLCSPDIRLFLRSENYEEGFEKLLAFVQQTKQEKISSIE